MPALRRCTRYYAGVTTGDPWIRESLWSEAIDRLDSELSEDLSNIGELCREIPLRIFGQILLDPVASLGRAGPFLPTMPSDDVQQLWTGNCGVPLLEQSVDFVKTVVEAAALQEIAPHRCRVLDFGIGWGRLARLWLKYGAPGQLDGCDAWDDSLDKARACGLKNRLVRSDPLLAELPFEESSFDVIWAFSVFTHLSPKATRDGLAGLRRMLRQRGTLVFTVRPHSYWDLPQPHELLSAATPDRLMRSEDVAFLQHQSDDPHYGDVSMSARFLKETCLSVGLEIVSMGWGTVDPYQIAVIARPI
jgi:SAM-dependent methyltransferase